MFRAPKIFKESLNATKTVTVRAAKGMKNKANLRHCRTPGDAGGGGADRGRRALSAEPAGRAVTLRSAGWAWRLLTRAEAGGRRGACVACGFSVNLNCPQVRRFLGRPVSCYSAVSLRAFLSTSITELFTRKTWEPPERPSGRLSFLCVFPPCLF